MALRTGLSLFSGGGGLDLGVRLVVPGLRTVGYVEREAFAAAVLVARMEEAALDPAPVWDDVSTFDGRPYRGRVDLVFGGFPCQDVSNAGKRAGIAGARSGLWSEFRRIVAEVRPRYVFVENVSALVARGLDVVLGDLAALRFDAEWGCFRASDVGAPHRRERVFILAHASGDQLRDESGRISGADGAGAPESSEPRFEVGNPLGNGLEGGVAGRPAPRTAFRANPSEWPPGPNDREAWAAVRPDLEPAIRRVADGLAYRVDRLRTLGNGVVPAQAAFAFQTLFSRLHP